MSTFEITDRDVAVLTKIATGKRTVLEFGPGRSTELFLSLGLSVDTCESEQYWYDQAIKNHPAARIFIYSDNPGNITIDGLREQYDLAFVDGPRGKSNYSRLNSLRFCARRTGLIVLHDADRSGERESIFEMMRDGWVCSLDASSRISMLSRSERP